ncbi:pentatricopeptide repeat-containing protein CRR2, chloroplastic-like [Bidens hawaiensis]|uniref:pentatricopeptide repeat-containing protein CRR2, chloroplastic-like n=1 Tax=Bidens hawaiensis TaxID=980011 RepID=UPI0040494F2E
MCLALECVWGIELHGFSIRMCMESDIFVAKSLLDMHVKFKFPVKASNACYIDPKNIVTWNAMLANYAQNGFESLALHTVTMMKTHDQVPNAVTLTSILPVCVRIGSISHGKQTYAKCGNLNLAQKVFNVSCKDRVLYNMLISAYSHTNTSFELLRLFRELLFKGLEPSNIFKLKPYNILVYSVD